MNTSWEYDDFPFLYLSDAGLYVAYKTYCTCICILHLVSTSCIFSILFRCSNESFTLVIAFQFIDKKSSLFSYSAEDVQRFSVCVSVHIFLLHSHFSFTLVTNVRFINGRKTTAMLCLACVLYMRSLLQCVSYCVCIGEWTLFTSVYYTHHNYSWLRNAAHWLVCHSIGKHTARESVYCSSWAIHYTFTRVRTCIQWLVLRNNCYSCYFMVSLKGSVFFLIFSGGLK